MRLPGGMQIGCWGNEGNDDDARVFEVVSALIH